ncbi:MAG TPA: polyprenol monophosphomannose synthase [Myxococcota bacterium]|nr:polyprenol monophosphomannose synthase [Myxococcota bacterium]HRY94816.1 polyprenol monophosphomannose synthase [Myxococcota bacterium]HSA22298.1 polyprenol monophosphomannose synthase [Myxococcota bacterium]
MDAARGQDTLVIVPTYCEKENLSALAGEVLAALACELLVVDDDSPDGTGLLADGLAAREPRLHVLHRVGAPRGLGRAYLDGFRWALERGYGFVAQMDADFSHDPAALVELRRACQEADLAIGSRYVPGGSTPGWSLGRRLISRGGSLYARLVLGLPLRDVTGGFKCWRAEALARLGLDSVEARGFAFQIEMNHRAVRAGLRVREVPIRFVDRQRGVSKMSTRIFLEGLAAVWRIRGKAGG